MQTEDLDSFKETRRRLAHLTQILTSRKNLLVITHENPDPDGIASAFALKFLARAYCRISAQVAFKGVIGRPENQMMIKRLHLKMFPLDSIRKKQFDVVALVDQQPRRTNQMEIIPQIVIDHHPRRRFKEKVEFVDVRKGIGANSTILFQYLKATGLAIPRLLTTALCYGIISDTQEFSRGTSQDDLAAYHSLFFTCDHEKLRRIRHPKISPEYFEKYWTGFRNALIWKDVITTYAGELTVPDMIGEIADGMTNIKGIKWSLAIGYFEKKVYLSVRNMGSRKDAGRIIRRTVGKRGSAGGHGFMAGGQIDFSGDPVEAEHLSETLIAKFLRILKKESVPDIKPVPLIKNQG